MLIQKSTTTYEKVKTGEFIFGIIANIEYDKEHKFIFQGTERVAQAARLVLKLQGYEYPHRTSWMKLVTHEKSGLYKKFISKLVENVRPGDLFDLDELLNMEVKTVWADDRDFQVIELITPVKKKISVHVLGDEDDFIPEVECNDEDDVPLDLGNGTEKQRQAARA